MYGTPPLNFIVRSSLGFGIFFVRLLAVNSGGLAVVAILVVRVD